MEEIDDVAARTAAAVANFMFVFLFLICVGCCRDAVCVSDE